jgi:hypothetical protein
MREKDPGKLLDLLEKSGEEVSKDPKLLEEIVGALPEVASLLFRRVIRLSSREGC